MLTEWLEPPCEPEIPENILLDEDGNKRSDDEIEEIIYERGGFRKRSPILFSTYNFD